MGIIPAQPPTEAGVGAELGNIEKLANPVVLVLGWVTGLCLHPTKT